MHSSGLVLKCEYECDKMAIKIDKNEMKWQESNFNPCAEFWYAIIFFLEIKLIIYREKGKICSQGHCNYFNCNLLVLKQEISISALIKKTDDNDNVQHENKSFMIIRKSYIIIMLCTAGRESERERV